MKKVILMVIGLLFSSLLLGCGKDVADTKSAVSDEVTLVTEEDKVIRPRSRPKNFNPNERAANNNDLEDLIRDKDKAYTKVTCTKGSESRAYILEQSLNGDRSIKADGSLYACILNEVNNKSRTANWNAKNEVGFCAAKLQETVKIFTSKGWACKIDVLLAHPYKPTSVFLLES